MQVHLGASPKLFFEFPTHEHNVWEILLCLHGTGTANIAGQEYLFREGTIFCIPPMTPHSKHSKDGYTDLSLFTADFTPPDLNRTHVFQDDADGSFRSLCEAAMKINLRGTPEADTIINSIADTLYLLLLQWNGTQRHPEAVDKFLRLLMDNLSNCDFDLSRAISETGYSPSYFRKLFRSSTGLAPIVCFNQMRVEYAKTLLRQMGDQQSIRQIAEAAGFSDPYYFSRVFKEQTGVSPTAYVAQGMIPLQISRDGSDSRYRNEHGLDPEQLENAKTAL